MCFDTAITVKAYYLEHLYNTRQMKKKNHKPKEKAAVTGRLTEKLACVSGYEVSNFLQSEVFKAVKYLPVC